MNDNHPTDAEVREWLRAADAQERDYLSFARIRRLAHALLAARKQLKNSHAAMDEAHAVLRDYERAYR